MNKVIVTGGAGFIGSHTVVELIAAGYTPIIVDNFSNSKKSVITNLEVLTKTKINVYEGDYQNPEIIKRIIKDHKKIDGVIHFAAYKSVGESVEQPLKYYENNVAGFIELLALLEANKITNLVFSSSCTVYGEPDRLPVTEESPTKPAVSPYGATKQMCELILSDVIKPSKVLKGVALRYFNPIGAHPSALIGELPLGVPANLVPFVAQTAAGIRKELTIFGDNYPTADGTNIRDYIHVVDLAKAHVKTLEYIHKQEAGFYDYLNVGTGKGSSVLEVIKTFEQATGKKLNYKFGARRPGDIVATYASCDKANKLLKWKAEKTLGDSLIDAWHWQKRLS